MHFNTQDANALKSIMTGWMTNANDTIQKHLDISSPMETYQFLMALQPLIDSANAVLDKPDRIELDMWNVLIENTDREIWVHPHDLLTLAVEGACSYWMDEDDVRSIKMKYVMGQVVSISFEHELRTNEWIPHTITLKEILSACNMILTNPELFNTDVHATILKTMFTEDWDYDADTADYIFQLAAFGELIYS
jgi:hypothetical protein